MDIILTQPINGQGILAARMLSDAGIPFRSILKDRDHDILLSTPDSIYLWKGIKGINEFIATQAKKE